MVNLYTAYDQTDYCDVPLDIYEENIKRIILLSAAAYTELSSERGFTLAPIPASHIFTGTTANMEARSITIEARQGDENESPRRLNIERIQIDIVIRSGQTGSVVEQRRVCCADIVVVKRVMRKIFEYGHVDDLTLGWPHADYAQKNRYTPPDYKIMSFTQFPLAQGKEKELGYSGGVRIVLQATYFPLK